MKLLRRSQRRGYIIAAVGTALLLLTDQIASYDLRNFLLSVTFILTVVLASMVGGWKPGALATLLGMIAHLFAFVEPRYALKTPDNTEFLRILAYSVAGGAISLLSEGLHRAWDRVAERQRLLELAERLALDESRRSQAQADFLQVTLSSIGDAVIATDAAGRITFMNRLAETLTGRSLTHVLKRPIADVYQTVDERSGEPLGDPCAQTLQSKAMVTRAHNSTLRTNNGASIPVAASAAPIVDDSDAVLGAVLVFHDASRERAATDALKRLAAIVSSCTDPIVAASIDGRITSWNEAAERLYGYTAQEAIGRHLHLIVPHARQQELSQVIDRLLAGERVDHLDTQRQRRDGSLVPVSLQISAIIDDAGQVSGLSTIERDITDRDRADAAMRLLTETSGALAVLTDCTSALARATRLMVRGFADFCVVQVVMPDGELRARVSAHRDPDREQLLQELVELQTAEWNDISATSAAIRTGRTQTIVNFASLRANAGSHQVLQRLAPRSAISVPLQIRGRVAGAITLAVTDRVYAAADIDVAEELAARVATAIDNGELLESVQVADRQKDEFIATLAHELRNPLAPIRNSVQILKAKNLPDPDVIWSQNVIERQVAQMARLLDDLLDVSRITRNKLELRKERVSLAEVIENAVETSRPLIEDGGHDLHVTLPADPAFLDADPVRLAQVFANLLNNAAKYTDHGGSIWLTGELAADQVVVSVRDTGIGIARELLPRMFEMFSQATTALERSQGGLGIGLSLVKGLVEIHGGSVEAHSDGPGTGSVFVVRLPIAEMSTSNLRSNAAPAKPASGLRIVVADDHRDAAESLAIMLRLMGHDVRVAHDGQAAIAAAEAFRPDVLLLDIGMPMLNGYETSCRIRAQPWGEPMVLIAVTGWGQEEDRRRSLESGFDYHMVKPVDPDALLNLLADASLRRR